MNDAMLPNNLMGLLQKNIGEILPSVLVAIGILIVGWIIASIFGSLARKGAQAFNKSTAHAGNVTLGLEEGVSKGVFWIIMLFAVMIAVNNLNIGQFAGPLNGTLTQTFNYLPKLVAAGVLSVIAWIVATLTKVLTTKALAATPLDSKFSSPTVSSGLAKVPPKAVASLSNNIGGLLFSFVILLFIPAILGALELNGLLKPFQDMVQKMLGFLPNIFGAGIIGVVGWMVAKILRNISTTVMNTAGIDHWGEKLGFKSETSIADLGGMLVFLVVFIPSLIAALNALGIEAISRPAVDMLEKIMTAIPNLLAASALLGITFYVGRFAASSVSALLQGMGFDGLPAKMGLTLGGEMLLPSALASKAILFFMMLFATVEAANMLGFSQLRDVVTLFIRFGGQILLGAFIFAVGFWLANLAQRAMIASGSGSQGAASLVRFTIIGLVTAMGLRAMGLADDIVNLAFGLTLGAVAVAFALSFGLGGREAAGKQMEYWLSNLRK